jgi:hypothetical protein
VPGRGVARAAKNARQKTPCNECHQEGEQQCNDHVKRQPKHIPDAEERLINPREEASHDIGKPKRSDNQQEPKHHLHRHASSEEVLRSGWLHIPVEQ